MKPQQTDLESVIIVPEDSKLKIENQFLVSNESIIIIGNQGFVLQGWSGAGTENDPYTLANVNLELNRTVIRLANTDAFFLIENVTISSGYYEGYIEIEGIALNNVRNGIIRNVEIRDKNTGISLHSSSNVAIHNTTYRDVSTSIEFYQSSNCILRESNLTSVTISDSENISISESSFHDGGIYVYYSNNLTVSNCYFKGFQYYYGSDGIYVTNSLNVEISDSKLEEHGRAISISNTVGILVNNCRIEDSYTAISFAGNRNCSVTDVDIWNSGFSIYSANKSVTNYQFSNLTIDNNPVEYFGGIENQSINGTEYSYIILQFARNIEIFNEIGMNVSSGLYILQSENVSVRKVQLKELNLESSNQIHFSNTTISEYSWISSSKDVSLLTSQLGHMHTTENTDLSITNCHVQSLSIGNSYNVTIESTVISAIEEIALHIWDSEQILVKDTLLVGTGMQLDGSRPIEFYHKFSNVSVNGKPLGYFVGLENSTITPDEYGQVIVVVSTDVVIESGEMRGVSNAVTIAYSTYINVNTLFLVDVSGFGIRVIESENINFLDITIFNGDLGIYVDTSYTVSITNCSFATNGLGLNIFNSGNVIITGNSIIGGSGIEIMDSDIIIVSENSIATEYVGISLYYYAGVMIAGNRISAGWVGIEVSHSAYWEQDLELVEIVGNTFYQCDIGVNIRSSYGVKVIGNQISKSWSYGIYLYESYGNTIAFNEIAFNEVAGVVIESGERNSIFGNLFHHNENNAIESSDNIWHDTKGVGNHWDNHDGEGPYQIRGSSNSYDISPLNITSDDYTLPLISSSSDITSTVSNGPSDLVWVVWINQRSEYVVFVDGTDVENGLMTTSGVVSFDFSEYPQGSHNITLGIYVESSLLRSDQVTVIIGSVLSSELLTLSTISVVMIVIVLLELKRRRVLK
jgi:parallel beta-helix repeat protein